jgi:hypothetical protein
MNELNVFQKGKIEVDDKQFDYITGRADDVVNDIIALGNTGQSELMNHRSKYFLDTVAEELSKRRAYTFRVVQSYGGWLLMVGE